MEFRDKRIEEPRGPLKQAICSILISGGRRRIFAILLLVLSGIDERIQRLINHFSLRTIALIIFDR
jgi:hypothetical protein